MSMNTPKMGLEPVNGADYVDNELFNRNYAKLDALGTCYVTASGTSGEWWYRKWSDGRAECGIDNKVFPNQTKTAWGAMFSTEPMSFGAYPFPFSSRPFASITFNNNDTSNHRSYVSMQATASTTQSPAFTLADPSAGPVGTPSFGIYVTGRVS